MFIKQFRLEFILHAHNTTARAIKNSLTEFVEAIDITENPLPASSGVGEGKDYAICTQAEDPTMIFDICAQFGRIRSVKVEEKEK